MTLYRHPEIRDLYRTFVDGGDPPVATTCLVRVDEVTSHDHHEAEERRAVVED